MKNINIDKAREELSNNGFIHLKKFWNSSWLEKFENNITKLYIMQANKIEDYRRDLSMPYISDFDSISTVCNIMEENDKEALYQVQKMMPYSQSIRKLFTEKFISDCSHLMYVDPNTTLLDGPALFINTPNTSRLRYKAHSEAHYYPKRRTFLNIWFPLFDKKNKDNGTMSVWPGSHKQPEWPFVEYTGYDINNQGKKNHFVQYEIPLKLLSHHGYRMPLYIEADPGDIIIFDRNLVHSSNANNTTKISFAGVARVWNPCNDLSLAGNIAATPYGGDIGRAGMVVKWVTQYL